MTEPEEPENPLVTAIAAAAADRDGTRMSFVMITRYDQDGTVTFPKTDLIAQWRSLYPSDNGTAANSLNNRWTRAASVLGRTTAVVRDSTTTIITDEAIIRWIASRNPMIASIQPGQLTLPVTPEEYDVIRDLVDAREQLPVFDGTAGLQAEASVGAAGSSGFGGGFELTATAEVVRDGQVI